MYPQTGSMDAAIKFKTFENRLRRVARRQELVIQKSRTRDPRAKTYGGYMLTDFNDRVVFSGVNGRRFTATLADIEHYLLRPFEEPANP
jgi:hypothetical protein